MGFLTDIKSVHPRLIFWDEINEFPSVCIRIGPETRTYQGGGYADRFLTLTIRGYVNSENPEIELESLLVDIENVIYNNGRLEYTNPGGTSKDYTRDITIQSIETDEGALAPYGALEVTVLVQY